MREEEGLWWLTCEEGSGSENEVKDLHGDCGSWVDWRLVSLNVHKGRPVAAISTYQRIEGSRICLSRFNGLCGVGRVCMIFVGGKVRDRGIYG